MYRLSSHENINTPVSSVGCSWLEFNLLGFLSIQISSIRRPMPESDTGTETGRVNTVMGPLVYKVVAAGTRHSAPDHLWSCV
ncbi:hypothetical protein J6590_002461 [Homalodisca vitripennis]|nr:hypothetical protein J6590_002461 [Homalodisca vitripennis]